MKKLLMKKWLMKGSQYFGAILALSISCNGAAFAQSDIETLIEQTGIEANDVAMRDLPNWHAPKKILVYGGFDIDDDLRGIVPGIQFVQATSESDAIAKAVDVDAIIGRCSNNLVTRNLPP